MKQIWVQITRFRGGLEGIAMSYTNVAVVQTLEIMSKIGAFHDIIE